ncbi:MAG: hypothetical protein DRJ98_08425 [Thermoprotei archaeon]|nr:MAG: hypothetical protein DRJ98_08425 [Thermoprotei archaeon]
MGSPYVAEAIADNEALKGSMRLALYPLIEALQASKQVYEALTSCLEVAVIATGLLACLLLGLIYLTPYPSWLLTLRAGRRGEFLKAALCSGQPPWSRPLLAPQYRSNHYS